MKKIPIFNDLERHRPALNRILKDLEGIEGSVQTKQRLDTIEALFYRYLNAEQAFVDSLTLSRWIPYRYYFSRAAADDLITAIRAYQKENLIDDENARALIRGIMEERLK